MMTRVDQDFNIFQELIIEGKQGGLPVRRKFILEEILNNKTRMHAEIKEACLERNKISVKLLVRVRNFAADANERVSGLVLRSRAAKMLSYEDDYVYIPMEKIYMLHLQEKREGNESSYTSFSHAPLIVFLQGVFSTKEHAEQYAQFYIGKHETPLSKQRLAAFLEERYQKMFYKYYHNNVIYCVWEIFQMVFLEDDSVRYQLIEALYSVMSHPATKLLHLRRRCKTLIVLIIAYQNYGLVQFRNAILNMYAYW